jgi:hypothetical protein
MAAGTARLKKHQPSNGAREWRWAWSLAAVSDPIVGSRHEGRCVKRCTCVQRALNYGTNLKKRLGFSLDCSQLDEMLPVMDQFINGFVYIGQGGVFLLFLETGVNLRLPTA